jgi:TRAP transporter 4TM/12TM fusion protein
MRELKGWMKWAVSVALVAIALFHLYTAIFGVFQPRIQRGFHLLGLLPMAYILYPATKKSPTDRPSIFDVIFAFLALLPPIYLMLNNHDLNLRYTMLDPVTTTQAILGWINIILVIEAVRRVVVPAMAILISVFFVYIFAAPYMSGIFWYKPMSLARVAEINFLLTSDGIYGSIVGVTATFVAIFVIFGAFMQNTKTGEYFTNLAVSLAGRSAGGPAKIAVISSGLFGSISGVAAANVYATGVFTIPLMKRLGYRAQFAGAVEAAASTGGLLMPPIMGAGAFVMSEITGIAYVHIIKAALIGAIFYFFSILVRVHFVAKKDRLSGMDESEIIPTKQILKDSYQLIPLILLIVLLSVGFSPFVGAVYGILATYILTFVTKETRMTFAKLWDTFELSGKNLIMLAVTCAGAGMVISIVTNTGLALGIASVIQSWSRGILLPALLLIMFTSILMGMGMPCTPAYIVAVTIGGPALQAMGIHVLTAHLFVFYFAILAEITPPVSIASYCGAAIAGSDPLKTGFEGMNLATVGFIIPFIFTYNPAFLLDGTFMQVLTLIIIVTYAVITLATAVVGYWNTRLKMVPRVLFGAAAVAFTIISMNLKVMHNVVTQVALVVSAVVVIVYFVAKMIASKKASAVAA